MAGFFEAPALGRKRQALPLIANCNQCRLYLGCKSPKMAVAGKGRKRIMVVGEAPGENEDDEGKPFVGKSGQMLQDELKRVGISLFRDCWVTNACICRPPKNELPPKSVDHCRPNIVKAINEHQPETIILLGAAAVKSVIGWLWRDDPGSIGRWIGWRIPSQRLNAWICPAWHPSYLLRTDYGVSGRENEVRTLLFRKHLKAAVRLTGRPWETVPDWKSRAEVELDPDKAAWAVSGMVVGNERPVAIDYETNMLKPDSDKARIWSCAVSDGRRAISFPWQGRVVMAVDKLLRSDVPKIASNMKFECRWSLREFGHMGRNWCWDTMLAAHVLDNRPEVSSIKFQAFALLGQETWDDEISPYLKAKHPNEENRIREAPLTKLLEYGGMDAILEWHVAKKQAAEFGRSLTER